MDSRKRNYENEEPESSSPSEVGKHPATSTSNGFATIDSASSLEPGPKLPNLGQPCESNGLIGAKSASSSTTEGLPCSGGLGGSMSDGPATRPHSVSSNFSSISSSGVNSMMSGASCHHSNGHNNDASANSGDKLPDGRTTLFVSGLPQDVKPRELYLMCRLMPGYERSVLQVKSAKHSPVGFITFATRQQATVAKQALNGVRFDPNDSRLLRVEFARKPTVDISNSSVASTTSTAAAALMAAGLPNPALLSNLSSSLASQAASGPGLLPSPSSIPIQQLAGGLNQGVSFFNLTSLLQNNPNALLASSGPANQPGILTLSSMPFQSYAPASANAPPGNNLPPQDLQAGYSLFPFKQM